MSGWSALAALDGAKGIRTDGLVVLGITLTVATLWCLSFTTARFGSPDALDYAQMGRELLEGHGFATAQAFPRHIPFLYRNGLLPAQHWPNLYRYPLTPLSNALLQVLIKDPARAAVTQSGLYFICTAVISYFLARRFCGRRMSLLCVLLLLAYPPMWTAAYSGLTETLASTLILGVFLVLSSRNSTIVSCFVLGVLCGLCFLGRTQLAVLLPVAFFGRFLILRPHKRPLCLSIFVLVGALAAILPWGLRNYSITRNFLFSFSSTRNLVLGTAAFHSDIEMQLHAPVKTTAVLGTYAESIFGKFLRNVSAIRDPTALVGNSVILFSLVGATVLAALVLRRNSRHRQIMRFGLWASLVLNFLIVCFAFPDRRFFLHFMPLIAVSGMSDLNIIGHELLNERGKLFAARLLLGGALVLVAITVANTARHALLRLKDVGYREHTYAELSSLVSPSELVASDVSHKVCFELGNPTLRLPAFPNDLYEINERYVPVPFVLLSPRITQTFAKQRQSSMFESYHEYRAHIASPRFQATFEEAAVLSNGAVLFRLRQHETVGNK